MRGNFFLSMIVKQNVTVYQCEFCKKKMFREHAMKNHEKWCTHNPINFTACSGCDHLEVNTFEWSNEHGAYSTDDLITSNCFRCKAKNVEMYPLKALKKELPTRYPHDFENKVLMLSKCELYKDTLPF